MEETTIETNDGITLAASLFRADTHSFKGCTLIVSSATGISRKFYSRYSKYMSDKGFDVITYDYRGIAESRPKKLKGFKADFTAWGQKDFSSVIKKTKDLFPNNRICVLGHSIGGTIFGMTPDCKSIEGVIMIGAQTSYYKDWPKKYRVKLYLLWHVFMPLLTEIFGFFPGKTLKMMEDIPKGVVKQWNERKRSPSMIKQLHEKNIELFYGTYSNRLLTLFIEDDFIGTSSAVDRVVELFSNADKYYEVVKPSDYSVQSVGHFGFFRKEFEDKLWPKTVEWYTKAITTANNVHKP